MDPTSPPTEKSSLSSALAVRFLSNATPVCLRNYFWPEEEQQALVLSWLACQAGLGWQEALRQLREALCPSESGV